MVDSVHQAAGHDSSAVAEGGVGGAIVVVLDQGSLPIGPATQHDFLIAVAVDAGIKGKGKIIPACRAKRGQAVSAKAGVEGSVEVEACDGKLIHATADGRGIPR